MSSANATEFRDVVAKWSVPVKGKVHTVEFEHGPMLSGKRVVILDGTVVVRRDFMFNLVGSEHFRIGTTKCCVAIISNHTIFSFKYTLSVDGKPLESFVRESKKRTRTWLPNIGGKMRRVVLETGDLTIYVDGKNVATTGEFDEEDEDEAPRGESCTTGSVQHFIIDNTVDCKIKVRSSGTRLHGLLYDLYVRDKLEEAPEDQGKAMAVQRND